MGDNLRHQFPSDVLNIVNTTNVNFKEAKKEIIKHINNCFCSLEIKVTASLQSFTSGKLFPPILMKNGYQQPHQANNKPTLALYLLLSLFS